MLVFLASAVLSAQSWLIDTTRRLPPGPPRTEDSAVDDVDADGDPDLFVVVARDTTRVGELRLMLNDGSGRFHDASAGRVPASDYYAYSITLGDLDGDGDRDLVLGCFRDPLRLYRNDGTGHYTDVTSSMMPPTTGAMRHRVHLFDVDGDGDLDLYAAGQEQAVVYLNDGSGNFASAAPQPSVPSSLVSFILDFDRDGDGDRDLLVGPELNVLENRNGVLYASPLPMRLARHAAAGDVDADGDIDLVLAQDGLDNGNRQDQLLLNDGSGSFHLGTLPAENEATGFVSLTDVDADGDLDLYCDNAGQARLMLNVGSGNFLDATAARLPFIENNGDQVYFRAHLADLDRDGDVDVLHTAANGRCEILWNRGASFFATGPFPPGHWYLGNGCDADVQGDGDRDRIAVGFDSRGRVTQVYANDGRGRFVGPPIRIAGNPYPRVARGDIDGDRDDDVLLYDSGVAGAMQLFLTQNLTFTDVSAQRLPTLPSIVNTVAFADLDGDGYVELVVGADRVHVYRNDGTGRFLSEMPVNWHDRPIVALAFGDVDGSGTVDIAACGGGGFDYILLNNAGQFVLRVLPFEYTIVRAGAALLDVDRDGDLDLVRGGLLSLNDGTGTFAPGVQFHPAPHFLTDGDIDGDGAADLAVADASSLRILLARPGGMQAAPVQQPVFGGATEMTLADLDADGDLDLYLVASTGDSTILANQSRHVYASDGARLGRVYSIEVAALAGSATLFRATAVIVGDVAARIALPPWGVLGVDLARAVVLPGAVLAPGVTRTRLDAMIPNNPALVGVTLHVQAAIADGVGGLRLTNTLAEPVQ